MLAKPISQHPQEVQRCGDYPTLQMTTGRVPDIDAVKLDALLTTGLTAAPEAGRAL